MISTVRASIKPLICSWAFEVLNESTLNIVPVPVFTAW
jgi:hypothetical protein